jgi:OOP family OmpA-OmpF porin
MIKKMAIALVILVAAISASKVIADQHQWELTGGLGYHWFDSDRGLDDSASAHFGAGYVVNPNWTVEAMATGLTTDLNSPSNMDVNSRYYHLDALYHFDKSGNWQPFAVLGAGHANYSPDSGSDVDETLINAGLGLKRRMSDNWIARGDVRLLNSLDNEQLDYALNLSLSYLFGHPVAQQAATPADSDRDGVIDGQDQCPNSPAGIQVDRQGCSLDSDGDGVYDEQDQCPNTENNLQVDSKGCPKTSVETITFNLEVNFVTDSAIVKDQELAEIKQLADFMVQYKTSSVVVEGHTDNTGKAAYNQLLSQRRAEAVRDIIINKMGIAADRVTAKGYGEDRPTADNSSREGRLKNRRVLAKVSSEEIITLKK